MSLASSKCSTARLFGAAAARWTCRLACQCGGDRETEGLGRAGDADPLADATEYAGVGLQDVRGTGLDEGAELVSGLRDLTGGDRRLHGARQLRVAGDVVG